MVYWKLILKRLIRRVCYAFKFKELSIWQYESCERCGHCYKLYWSVKDSIWNLVQGNENGCLCIDCFVELAKEKNVRLSKDDFEHIEVFLP
ncbi:MAG: hypothetical protein PHF86_07790 [Candidatus Nanoarchaeia archaeon]|jgi:hypothetical protein|nr:hypothetical protein [Candidatus Nanoarchaeia archaeon]